MTSPTGRLFSHAYDTEGRRTESTIRSGDGELVSLTVYSYPDARTVVFHSYGPDGEAAGRTERVPGSIARRWRGRAARVPD